MNQISRSQSFDLNSTSAFDLNSTSAFNTGDFENNSLSKPESPSKLFRSLSEPVETLPRLGNIGEAPAAIAPEPMAIPDNVLEAFAVFNDFVPGNDMAPAGLQANLHPLEEPFPIIP